MPVNIIKALYFPAWYPSRINALPGKFVQEHADALHETKKVRIGIFHPSPDPDLASILRFEAVEENGIPVYRMYYKAFAWKILKPVNFLLSSIANVIGSYKAVQLFGLPDICHVHVLTRAGIVPFVLNKVYKIPYLITEHWSRYLPIRNGYNGAIRKWLTNRIVANSSGISAVSAGLRSAMRSHNIKHPNFITLANASNARKFMPVDNNRKVNQRKRFLHVSGLTDSVKNVRGILLAADLLRKVQPDFELHIVGKHDDKPDLIDYAKSLKLCSHVFFHGELRGDALVKQYQLADAFVLFSNFENQPVVLIEAFLCGLPVIATRAGGIPEMVNASNGILIPAQSSEALSDAMFQFTRGELEFDSAQIRDDAKQKYSYENVAEQMLSFYQSAISASGKSFQNFS